MVDIFKIGMRFLKLITPVNLIKMYRFLYDCKNKNIIATLFLQKEHTTKAHIFQHSLISSITLDPNDTFNKIKLFFIFRPNLI